MKTTNKAPPEVLFLGISLNPARSSFHKSAVLPMRMTSGNLIWLIPRLYASYEIYSNMLFYVNRRQFAPVVVAAFEEISSNADKILGASD